CARLRTGMDVW
nr:immunoglobulin heavy chain junction region [Macaca mulatta]